MKIEITYSRYPNMKEAKLFEKRDIKILGLKFTIWKQTDFYRTLDNLISIQVSAWMEQHSIPFEMVKDWTLEEVNEK